MGINLLAELDSLSSNLRAGEFATAFFLTYSLSLPFFEQLVSPRLDRLGVVNVGVLTDEHGYRSSLSDPLGQEHCGRSYVIGTPRRKNNLQHAKMLWLHGEYDIVYLGSHNLTMSGYNNQLEVTLKLDSLNPTHRNALRDLHRAVSLITAERVYLEQVWSRIPVPPETKVEPTIRFLWNGEQGLLRQLTAIVAPVRRITVVTPFLDAAALAELKEGVGASQVKLIVPNEGTDTPLADACDAVTGLTVACVGAGRRLHGKAYCFESDEHRWLALGSANCTAAGLVKRVQEGGNIEFLLLVPDGSLQEDELNLEPVDDVGKLSGTGRRWDEEKADISPVRIDLAEYSNGILTVYWEPLKRLSGVHLVCGEQRYTCTESPFRVQRDMPPSIISIEGEIDGKVLTTSAWIVFPEELGAQVSKARARRWHEYLQSEDPGQLAAGIDAYLLQLLRDMTSSEGGDQKQFREFSKPDVSKIQDAIEIFAFSSDQKRITSAAAVLVYGSPSIDPLGALRGLIVRMQGPSPSSIQNDEEALTRYEQRRERAARRIIDRLISHLDALVSLSKNWASTPLSRAVTCLRGTFEAVALLWHDVITDDPRPARHERFVESFLRILKMCNASDKARAACKDVSVAGPLVLAIGAAAEAASETDVYELLKATAKKLVADPQSAADSWLTRNGDRAVLLLTHGTKDSSFTAWLRPALRLLGQLDLPTYTRQAARWSLLLRLYDADRAGDASAANLCLEAEQQYGDNEVWQWYRAARDAGQPPRINRVDCPTCSSCYVQLPDSVRNKLERGDAALCPNCKSILLWGGS